MQRLQLAPQFERAAWRRGWTAARRTGRPRPRARARDRWRRAGAGRPKACAGLRASSGSSCSIFAARWRRSVPRSRRFRRSGDLAGRTTECAAPRSSSDRARRTGTPCRCARSIRIGPSVTSRPPMSTIAAGVHVGDQPRDGVCSRVDLPQPEGPSRTRNSPSCTGPRGRGLRALRWRRPLAHGEGMARSSTERHRCIALSPSPRRPRCRGRTSGRTRSRRPAA